MSSRNTATSNSLNIRLGRVISIALTVAAALMVIGCDTKPNADSQLILYCGAGIRPPAAELIEVFAAENNVEISPDFAGSEVLLSKIKLSRRGDLYMPGDAYYVDQAAEAELVLSRKRVGYWVPTILVQKGNPKNIKSLQDLLKDGVRVGTGDPTACAIGRTTKMLFEKNGIEWPRVEKNLTYKSLTVNELGVQIQAKSLDAVIVWDAMARYFEKHGDPVSIPPEDNTISSIDIAVLNCTSNRALAEKFTAFLASEKGREIFEKHRYTTENPLK